MARESAVDVPLAERACVSWDNVEVVAPSKAGGKKLLTHVSGYVDPAHMVAIMGPSGSGKTTLLDALAGRTPKNLELAGDIRVNGHAGKMSYGTVAYVPQEDLLTGTLTVRETLEFTARLRMPIGAKERRELVEAVMVDLGLLQAADAPVGTVFIKGISGGQKRRLSIACEVLVGPAIMFLDEPTSGLDAAAAFFCVSALKTLAEQGRSLVMSIHQPSAEIFDLFDHLLLLSRGEMIFFGLAAQTATFYAEAGVPCPPNRALADHFIHSMNTDFQKEAATFATDGDSVSLAMPPDAAADSAVVPVTGKALAAVSAGSGAEGSMRSLARLPPAIANAQQGIKALRGHFEGSLRAELTAQVAQRVAAGGPRHRGIANAVPATTQFFALLHRSVLNALRDIGVFWLRLAMYVGLSLALGTIYFDLGKSWNDASSRGGLIFFSMSFLTFMSISGFPSFVDEMRVFVRERLNGYYGAAAYTAANSAASVPFLALIAVACSVVVYFLAALNSDGGRVIYFMLCLFAALSVVEGMMMAIAAVVPHYLLGLAAGAGLMGVFMPVAGYVIPIDSIPDPVWRYPMHYLGYHTYAMHGMMVNEFEDTGDWRCPCEVQPGGCNPPGCRLDGEGVLAALDYPTGRSKWWDLGVLALMAIVFRVGFFVMLKVREALAK